MIVGRPRVENMARVRLPVAMATYTMNQTSPPLPSLASSNCHFQSLVEFPVIDEAKVAALQLVRKHRACVLRHARPDDRSENISMDRDVSITSKGHAFWLAVVKSPTQGPMNFDHSPLHLSPPRDGLSLCLISHSFPFSCGKRFDQLSVNGALHLSRSMKESSDFAGELFDALKRRRNITGDKITKADGAEGVLGSNLRSKLRFPPPDLLRHVRRLPLFKKRGGRVESEDETTAIEPWQIIPLSASAKKLPKTQEKAEDQLLSQRLKPTQERNPLRWWYQRAKYLMEDCWQRVWVVALWLCVCAAFFAWKFEHHRRRAVYHVMDYCICVPKGGAETLKFNMALILLPVCRNTLTWPRTGTKFGKVLPFNDSLSFHKVCETKRNQTAAPSQHDKCDSISVAAGDRGGHRSGRGAAHDRAPDVRLPAAAARDGLVVRADEALPPAGRLLVVRVGVDGGGHGGADGRGLHPRHPLVPPRFHQPAQAVAPPSSTPTTS
ncbi:hypothetical protein B296_00059166 [Ensete ventricosum]|uniref:NADPH oxidase Respiratory burst domain-containing protein n=1 Tax=Ensete ventricosum TaxID=4639 RepID=A0A426XIT3_ENSVE|nr:hypothetical protein B296_00059166 [Ensete ventricosum]